jgi:DNA-binding response OmpR family regulator
MSPIQTVIVQPIGGPVDCIRACVQGAGEHMNEEVKHAVAACLERLQISQDLLPCVTSMGGKPLRFGQLVDRALKIKSSARDEIYEFSGVILYPRLFVLQKAAQHIELTEKEVAILKFLYDAKAPMPRKMLLDRVWGYSDDVETHTIETHIYRLRQKIEDDPSMPKIIVTTAEGYKLKR